MNGLIAVANAPGVYQAIKAGISSVLNSMMVLPKRIDIPLTDEITNEIRFRFAEQIWLFHQGCSGRKGSSHICSGAWMDQL